MWYLLKWKGWDEKDATWQKESDCNCSELIEEYELLHRQQDDETAARERPVTAAPAMELGVATVVQWWLTDKSTSSRRGLPTVRCSYLGVQPAESGSVCGVAQQSAVQAPAASAA